MVGGIVGCGEKENRVEEVGSCGFVKEVVGDMDGMGYRLWRYGEWRVWEFVGSGGK